MVFGLIIVQIFYVFFLQVHLLDVAEGRLLK